MAVYRQYSPFGLLGVSLSCCLQCLFHDFRNSVFSDAVGLAVLRLHPNSEVFCPLARITRGATSGNILGSDDACVVDDMLPRCDGSPRSTLGHPFDHLDTAVDTNFVPCLDFFFEPSGDAPAIHHLPLFLYAQRRKSAARLFASAEFALLAINATIHNKALSVLLLR